MPNSSRHISSRNRIQRPASLRCQNGTQPAQHRRSAKRKRSGFTLLEVLIATAVTLLMMVSLAQIFKVIGDSMRQGRAALELNNRLRSVVLRIRGDLENATAIVDPPADPKSGTGYLKYYDGSLTDYSAALWSAQLRAADPALYAEADFSRFGDVDDVLMFTARAGDVWFTGKVPLFLMTGDAADTALVTIASQHAEIAVFAEPLPSNVGNPSRSLEPLVDNPANAYEKVAFVNGSNQRLDLPAGYRLYYRTLLIRPDLNQPDLNQPNTGLLPFITTSPVAGLPSPTCDMASAYQLCDLSMRRVEPLGPNVAANSLEDLVNPANRFAHVQIPVLGALSMPILALSPKLDMPYTVMDAGSTTISNTPAPLEFQSGFLHPAFALFGDREGEDLLATNVLAFDIRGYDPGVPLLPSFGPDGAPGFAGIDDDGSLGVDNPSEIGWAGSDDVILSPNDPGYISVLGANSVGTGEYVDLGWARKTMAALQVKGDNLPANSNLWSQLSGFSQANFMASGGSAPLTDAFYKSGLAVQSSAGLLIYQPSYDTWSSAYEGDGLFQAERTGSRGVVVGPGPAPREAWRNGLVDAGADGLDNLNSAAGVDDPTELETSPPFPSKLRGLSITIRMEDPATRTVKQMSVAKEFVTQ